MENRNMMKKYWIALAAITFLFGTVAHSSDKLVEANKSSYAKLKELKVNLDKAKTIDKVKYAKNTDVRAFESRVATVEAQCGFDSQGGLGSTECTQAILSAELFSKAVATLIVSDLEKANTPVRPERSGAGAPAPASQESSTNPEEVKERVKARMAELAAKRQATAAEKKDRTAKVLATVKQGREARGQGAPAPGKKNP
jgi:hypothetical protein